ncbi:hypothetical protein [Rhodococcus sp. SORGH_AS_0301]|uniref:hypothetical protein n=1 Tax=Rhodococcus sp. SORGH_AS_0301 TaxID=3041780 RepID=UPI00278320BB|nr:hypothetical protein [Rhodococcus sp. SORGH_AS_0301]MDQ1181982.1 hypothetical protein [Rhodococcus sp. SORGH_AS_0301]
MVEQNITGSSESPLQSTIARVAQKIEVAVGGFFALVGADLGDDDLHLVGPLGVQPDLRLRRRREDVARTRGGFVDLDTFLADTIWCRSRASLRRGITIPNLPLERLLDSS